MREKPNNRKDKYIFSQKITIAPYEYPGLTVVKHVPEFLIYDH